MNEASLADIGETSARISAAREKEIEARYLDLDFLVLSLGDRIAERMLNFVEQDLIECGALACLTQVIRMRVVVGTRDGDTLRKTG